MIKKYKKVGTTFLGLSCLLGAALTFTGCDTYDYGSPTSSSAATYSYYDDTSRASYGRPTEDQLKRTYNVDTVKLYEACMMVMLNGDYQISSSEKPQRPGGSGYISLKKYTVASTTFGGGSTFDRTRFSVYVTTTPTFIMEKGSSETTSVLRIQPRWYEYRDEGGNTMYSSYINREFGSKIEEFYSKYEKRHIEEFFSAIQSHL